MTLKRYVAAVCLLGRLAAAQEAEEDSKWAWVIHSGDGKATLRQKPSTPDRCYLECTSGDGSVAWKANAACLAEKADWKFMAPDCTRTVVLIPAPPRGKPWRASQVMRVYKKEKLDYQVMGIAVLKDEKLMKASPTWVKGCYGVPGDPPRYSADGLAIEYESIDGKRQTVPLIKR
jgi:hypothetical protein